MATTRIKLDELGENIIQTFLENEELLLSSHMPTSTNADILDENKFGGTNFSEGDTQPRADITKYGVVGYPDSFDDAYQNIANDAWEGEITALSKSDGWQWGRGGSFPSRKPPVLTDDYRNVLAEQTTFERLKVRNILDQFLHVYDVDSNINSGKQFPNARKSGIGDFKGSTGSFSRYRRSVSYDGEWFRYQGSGYTSSPTAGEQRMAARKGLISGQLDPRYFRGIGSPIGTGSVEGAAAEVINELFADPDSPFNDFLPNLLETVGLSNIIPNITRISQLYMPGFPRPAEAFRTQKVLDETLQQNLLLPPNIANKFPHDNPANDSPENVFLNLYTQNRSAKSLEPILSTEVEIDGRVHTLDNFKKGQIAGTAIEDIEYQDGMEQQRRTGIGTGFRQAAGGEVLPFLRFSRDVNDLSQNRKDAGFSHNIPSPLNRGTTYSPNMNSSLGLGSPAIRSFIGKKDQQESEKLTNRGGDSQYFPFCFSTINKDNRYEICYLQGTLASFNEGYVSTWSPKSYIGRSEQIHTYTFTDRTIDIEFSVFADTGRMLQNVYERVLWLAQQTYPDYDEKKNLKDGPLIAMRIGDLIPYQEGFIKTLGYDWNFLGEGGKWELTKNKRMPQACKISLSFQPIHRRVPDRDFNFYSSSTRSLGAGFVSGKNMSAQPYVDPPGDMNTEPTREDYYLLSIERGRLNAAEANRQRQEDEWLAARFG